MPIPYNLYYPAKPSVSVLSALSREVEIDTHHLAFSQPGSERIKWRCYLIEDLEALRLYAGEGHYRAALSQIRTALLHAHGHERVPTPHFCVVGGLTWLNTGDTCARCGETLGRYRAVTHTPNTSGR